MICPLPKAAVLNALETPRPVEFEEIRSKNNYADSNHKNVLQNLKYCTLRRNIVMCHIFWFHTINFTIQSNRKATCLLSIPVARVRWKWILLAQIFKRGREKMTTRFKFSKSLLNSLPFFSMSFQVLTSCCKRLRFFV